MSNPNNVKVAPRARMWAAVLMFVLIGAQTPVPAQHEGHTTSTPTKPKAKRPVKRQTQRRVPERRSTPRRASRRTARPATVPAGVAKPADPHAGHNMQQAAPTPTPTPDPHAGHVMHP